MRDEQAGLMEEEILTEDDKLSSLKQSGDSGKNKSKNTKFDPYELFTSLKKLALSFKKPKIITLIILFASILAIYSAFALLAAKRQPEVITQQNLEFPSPSPVEISDPGLIQIASDIDKFKQEVDKQENFSSELFPPVIDLEISFK